MLKWYVLLLQSHPPYLENYKTPCWREELPSSYPYSHSFSMKYLYLKNRFLTSQVYFQAKIQNGEPWRLRCLPYFYVAGFTKCGTSDLYDKISQHPHVIREEFKELQWWKRRRVTVSHYGGMTAFITQVFWLSKIRNMGKTKLFCEPLRSQYV